MNIPAAKKRENIWCIKSFALSLFAMLSVIQQRMCPGMSQTYVQEKSHRERDLANERVIIESYLKKLDEKMLKLLRAMCEPKA